MQRSKEPSRIKRWSVLAAVALVVIGFCVYVNARQRRGYPQSIAGNWLADDLRIPDDKLNPVTFSDTGELIWDPTCAIRWRFDAGTIWVRAWSNESDWQMGRLVANTTAYSWFVRTEEFPVVPTFNEDGTVMTLAFPGEEPHVRLRRTAAPEQNGGNAAE